MLLSKKNIFNLMALLVFIFSVLSFSTGVSAKKPVMTIQEKKKIAAEIKKLETSNNNFKTKTKATEKKLLLVLDENEYTIQLIEKYEEQSGDYDSFKEVKTELTGTYDDMKSYSPVLYDPYKIAGSEIKKLKGQYTKQSYKESTKQIKRIKSDISDGSNAMSEINSMLDTTNKSLKEIQKEVQSIL